MPSEKLGWVATGVAAGGLLVYLLKARNRGSLSSSAQSFFGTPKPEINALLEKPTAPITLLSADFCPFAARAWIALLEKGVLFEHVHCCYFMGERDPGTRVLYELGLKTVPAMIHNGRIFTESMELANYIDDAFPGPALKPVDAAMVFNMNLFLSRHSGLCGYMYTFLMNQDPSKHAEFADKYNAMLKEFNDDLAMFDGPYLCGEEFTLADLQIFGFVERALIVLPAYKKGWCIPSELTHIPKWFAAMKARDSIKIVAADRTEISVKTYCYEAKSRNEYLIELYQCYANNEVGLAKEKNKADGKPGFNAYKRFKDTH